MTMDIGPTGTVSDGEVILTGWLCAERSPNKSFSPESYGIVLSSENTSRKFGCAGIKCRLVL